MDITTKKTVKWDEEVAFTNWTDEDFEAEYGLGPDKKIYRFESKKSYYVPFYLAEYAAKHLADREYNKVFTRNLDKVKSEVAGRLDRRDIEHRVQNSPEVSQMSVQEMKDRCVTILSEEQPVAILKPQEVKLREAVLKRDTRAQEMADKFGFSISSTAGSGGLQANAKALEQAQDDESQEFEQK